MAERAKLRAQAAGAQRRRGGATRLSLRANTQQHLCSGRARRGGLRVAACGGAPRRLALARRPAARCAGGAGGEPHGVPQSGQSAAVLCVVTRLSPGRVRASHLAPLLRWTLIEASYRPAEDETLPCSERAAIGKVRESHCTRCVASHADARFRAFLAHFPYLSKRWQRPLHPPLLRSAPLLRPPQRLLLWAAAMRSPAVSTPPFWKRCLPSCELR